MTDGDFILSWGADDDDQVTQAPAELARDLPDAPGSGQVADAHTHSLELELTTLRGLLEILKDEGLKWREKAGIYETRALLMEQHVEDMKQDRMELRNEIMLLKAELAEAKGELERAKKQPWWKKG